MSRSAAPAAPGNDDRPKTPKVKRDFTMIEHPEATHAEGIIATIENKDNPSQVIAIKYVPEEQSFVTSGIQVHFGEKELMMPAHLVVIDLQLIGTIVSAILEKISHAQEMETTFQYTPGCFEVLNKKYSLTEYGAYMKLQVVDD